MKTKTQITEMFAALLALNDLEEDASETQEERLQGMLLAFAWTMEGPLPPGFKAWFDRVLILPKAMAMVSEKQTKRKKAKSHQISKAE
jgi:hypothetical protein